MRMFRTYQPPKEQEVVLIQDEIGGAGSSGFEWLLPILILIGILIRSRQQIMMQPSNLSTTAPSLSATVSLIPEQTQQQTTGACIPMPCPSGYVQIQNKCYRYVKVAATWENANQMCMTSGATLWEPTSQDELSSIIKVLNLPNFFNDLWTGANDRNIEGLVQYIGSNNNFNLSFGSFLLMPNSIESDCVAGFLYGPYIFWEFTSCTVSRMYVCESVVPTCP